jgi:hypothetical protein
MAYTFKKLTKADRKAVAEQQVTQFEGELWSHMLNRARLLAAGQDTVDTDQTIATVQQAIETTVIEAQKLA